MHGMVNASESGVNCKIYNIKYKNLQHTNLFWLKSSPLRIELLAHSSYSNIICADPITNHLPKLSSKSAMRNERKRRKRMKRTYLFFKPKLGYCCHKIFTNQMPSVPLKR